MEGLNFGILRYFNSNYQSPFAFDDLVLSSPVPDYTTDTFSWPEYLAKTGGIEAPPHLFKQVSDFSAERFK